MQLHRGAVSLSLWLDSPGGGESSSTTTEPCGMTGLLLFPRPSSRHERRHVAPQPSMPFCFHQSVSQGFGTGGKQNCHVGREEPEPPADSPLPPPTPIVSGSGSAVVGSRGESMKGVMRHKG